MQFKRILFFLLFVSSAYVLPAQLTLGTSPTSYYFLGSYDNNVHLGFNIRGGLDYDRFQIDLGFSYFLPVISKVNTVAYEINPTALFRQSIPIINSVDGNSFETSLQFNYFIYGQPIGGRGFYGFIGTSYFVYTQKNNLSSFDRMKYYSDEFIDKAQSTTGQITFDFGIGGKLPLRNKSLFAEFRFAIPTDPYKDYGLAVSTTNYLSLTTGVRWHLVTRKNRYQIISNRKARSRFLR